MKIFFFYSAINELMEHSDAEPFIAPVDYEEYTDYPNRIPYPIDLNTIKERLKHGFYR